MSNLDKSPLYHCRTSTRGGYELSPNEYIGWPTIRSRAPKSVKVSVCHFTEQSAIEKVIRTDLHERYDITTLIIDTHLVYIEVRPETKAVSPITLRQWKCELYIIPIYTPRLATDVWIDDIAPFMNGVAIKRTVDFTARRTLLLSKIWRDKRIVVSQPCGKTNIWQYDNNGELVLIHRSK